MDGTPANSCLYGHPVLWRKTTNILQLQTWLHILRHVPSKCTFQSQQHHSCSHWPQEKATSTLKLLSPAVLVLMDAWTTDWIMGLKRREQNRAGGLWALAAQEKQCFRAEKKPPRLICLHSSCFVTIPEGLCWVHTLHFYWCWQGWDPLHFIAEEYTVCPACCPLSTKSRDGRTGVWNWSLKYPHVSFCSTGALLALSSSWSVLCTSYSYN